MSSLGLWLLLLLPVQATPADVALAAMRPTISAEHPSVQWIDIQALRQKQATMPQPLILDVRTEAEWREGHLAGAIRVPHDAQEFPAQLTQDSAQAIVVYCAVGYRSAVLAERLLLAGYTQVQNLEGGIFAWANAGLPMVRDGQPTTQAHPYNAIWGKMLHPDHRATVEPIP